MDTGSQNPLYPVFLKLHQLSMLIVGAGEVGYEKLSFILKSSPEAHITVVAPRVSDKVAGLLERQGNHHVQILERKFRTEDVRPHDLVIAATNLPELNKEIHRAAKHWQKLVNVADTPALCDFYLGSIVTRGNLKIAISTNGQSPTFAKRFRQLLEQILPEETSDLLLNLRTIRDQLKGDFAEKVKQLNQLTASLIANDYQKQSEDA